MALLEALAIAIGPSIAKNILKVWLGEGVTYDIIGSLVDFFGEKSTEYINRQEMASQLDKIGENVANRLKPLYENEFKNLSKDDRTVVVHEFANTLEQAQITAILLIQNDLDPTRFRQYLVEIRPDATKLFSSTQEAFYDRLINEISTIIMSYADKFSDFDRLISRRFLQNQNMIVSKLDQILATPNKEASEYERIYRYSIEEFLNQFEQFGIPKADNLAKKQDLVNAFIVLNSIPTGKSSDLLERISREELHFRIDISKDIFQCLPVDQILPLTQRLVIRGDAGSGKSTLLKWLAVQASRGKISGMKDVVPFYIALRKFVDKKFPAVEDLPYLCCSVGAKPGHWVHDIMDNGRALVLIDGVDELPVKQRSEMLINLRLLVRTYPLARYVIASRPPALKVDQWPEWQDWVNEEFFVDVTLQEMDELQVKKFISKWYETLHGTISSNPEKEKIADYPQSLFLLLKRRPPLYRLASNPLLCAMICALYYDRQETLPSGRIRLYDDCIQMLLTRRDEIRKINLSEDYPILDEDQKNGIIRDFAYWMMKNDYSDVETEDADEFFKNRLPFYDITKTTGEKIRGFFADRANLLREPVLGRIDFTHRTFQEFLAARGAIDSDEIGFLIKNSLDDLWREAIILAAGLGNDKQRQKLVTGLLKKADELKSLKNVRYLRILALACLETRTGISPDLRAKVLEKAAEFFPPKDRDEARMIAKAGDPAIPLLLPRPLQSKEEAASCQFTLHLIGGEIALSALEQYASQLELSNSGILVQGFDFFENKKYGEQVLSKINYCSITKPLSESFNYLYGLKKLDIINERYEYVSPEAEKGEKVNTRFNQEISLLSNLTDLSFLTNLGDLKELRIIGINVGDLTPLANLHNLVELRIIGLPVTDLSPLANLISLSKLELIGMPISDLSPLNNLTNLTQLSLYKTSVHDLSPLANLNKLEELCISETEVSDLSTIRNLDNLLRLDISWSKIVSLEPVIRLSKLNSIWINLGQLELVKDLKFKKEVSLIYTNDLSDTLHSKSIFNFRNANEEIINPYKTNIIIYASKVINFVPNRLIFSRSEKLETSFEDLLVQLDLEGLILQSPDLNDLSILSNQVNLSKLWVTNSNVSDLSPIANISLLKDLALSNTKIRDISVLSSLYYLENLDLSGTNVMDISELKNLSHLLELDLSGTLVNDLSPIENLSHLKELNLSGLIIKDISALKGLTSLTKLNLSGTAIQDLSALAELFNLRELNISETKVTNLSPIADLTNLTILNLKKTFVSDLSPLSKMSKLKKLIIKNTPVSYLDPITHLKSLQVERHSIDVYSFYT